MAWIERFEDIQAWQCARELVKSIYAMTRTSAFKADHGLQRQIQRAAVSVMSNIAEGFESQTHKQFVRYLYIAKASSGEVRSQLYICRDLHYISEETFIALSEQATNCSRLISGFIRYLETQSK